MANRRLWFAEDMVVAMERLTQVRDEACERINATAIVAAEFGMEPASFNALIHDARQKGLAAYPKRPV